MLEIDRLSLQVRAAAAPERAERLARRLRDAAVRGIERDRYALAPPGSPAYVFVERLAVHCAVSSDWDDAAIGAEVARALAAALEQSIAAPQTIAFRDRTELLAAFYAALAEGRAWERWWFEEFDGLKPLAASAALRTSVINEGERGIAALARLTSTSLEDTARLLAAGDAARLVEWLSRRRPAAQAAVAPLWNASAALRAGEEESVALLRALVAAERAAPGAANGETLQVLRAMARLRAAAARRELSPRFFAEKDPVISLRAALAALSLETHWLIRITESEAALIVEEISPPSGSEKHSSPPETGQKDIFSGERLRTQRGGVFVLLKALDWLGWPAQWARESPDVDELARALAWAVALRAVAPRGTAGGLRDPALAMAFNVAQPQDQLKKKRREVRRMLEGRTVTQAAAQLLEHLSQRIPGLAGASPGYLRRNALALPATVERQDGRCMVRLGRAPLDILLVLAGAKSGRIALPGATALELRAEDGA